MTTLPLKCKEFKTLYLDSTELLNLYPSLSEDEKEIVINHYIINNPPIMFESLPLEFDHIKRIVANSLQIDMQEVILIGSSKVGFSISPDSYGVPKKEKTDLDLAIISDELFNLLKKDFDVFKNYYKKGCIIPSPTPKEQTYWDENKRVCTKTISRGFIDSNKIPNRDCCPHAQTTNQVMYVIVKELKDSNFEISHASARIYKDWTAFRHQLKLNTDYCINEFISKNI